MPANECLCARLRSLLSGEQGVGERKMFGGVCFTVDGSMACGVVGSDLVVRVGPDAYEEALTRAHTRPMDFTGRALKGFVYVSEAGWKRSTSLRAWVRAGVQYARAAPRRPRRKGMADAKRR